MLCIKTFQQYLKFTPLILTFSSSTAFTAVLPGDLLITEIMTNPAAVSDSKGEWFEIQNTSGHNLDINGLTVKDNGSNHFTIDQSLIINAGDYFVLGKNGDTASNGGYTADYIYSGFTLSNSSDAIILEFDGAIIDSVIYNEPELFAVAGNSVALINDEFTLTASDFQYGDGDIGTPGEANNFTNISEVPLPASGWMMATALSGLMLRYKKRK